VATITASYLRLLARYVGARGVDTSPFFRALGLAEGEEEQRVAIEQLYALWELAARALDDPGLPIAYAEQLRIEDHHVLGFATMSAPSGSEALRILVRFSELASDSGAWSITEQREGVMLTWTRVGTRSLGLRLTNEAVLCEVVAALRQIMPGCEPKEVRFRHRAPRDARAHRRFFAAPMLWTADSDALLYDADLLTRRPASENPGLLAYFAREAQRRKDALAPLRLSVQVARAIASELSEGAPEPNKIARRLALSPSGLREQLRREGTNFRALLDDARKERAAELLRANERSISEIALLLGFSETSAFTRAYTRWHGVPPRSARLPK
jgi:AraC-like DNA-binding protein